MPTVTIQYNGATISVRETIGRDELDVYHLRRDLLLDIAARQGGQVSDLSNLDLLRCHEFIMLVLRSTIEGELDLNTPWKTIDQHPTRVELLAMYDALMEGPPRLMHDWHRAAREADYEIVDPEELTDVQT